MNLIVATSTHGGIGWKNTIPWSCPDDMRHFKSFTMDSIVIMGHNTYKSIGHPLSGRVNIVMTRQPNKNEVEQTELYFCTDIYQVLKIVHNYKKPVFIMGGSEIYNLFLNNHLISTIYLSEIPTDVECDVFFRIPSHFNLVSNENRYSFVLKKYIYVNPEEGQYTKLIHDIVESGERVHDRTGVGCVTLFGNNKLEFNLQNGQYPLFTHRNIPFRHVFEELMFFIRGETDVNILRNKNIHIWDGNTTRQALDANGLHDVPEYTMVNGYGEHWRRFGSAKGRYSDQIMALIENIRNIKQGRDYKFARRLILSSWNPDTLDRCALPGCHFSYQFHVSQTGELSCLLYQRSSDVALALGWNIATAALLTFILADQTGTIPKSLHVCVSNAHIYTNHLAEIDTIKTSRTFAFPRLYISRTPSNITDYTFEDMKLMAYHYNKTKITLPMNV